ncbi:MAG: restriction endonuclease [Thermoplasmata archaeon]|jgi:restriction system protein|nr:restriction endonuclease [Thermoplasmata archaeon]
MAAFEEEAFHEGLHEYKIIKGSSPEEVRQKKAAIMAKWDEKWQKQCEREAKIKNDEDSLAYAKELTADAEKVQAEMDTILVDNMKPFSINALKDHSEYTIPKPYEPAMTAEPPKPDRSHSKYNVELSGLAKLSKKKVEENDQQNEKRYQDDVNAWEAHCQNIKAANGKKLENYEADVKAWEKARDEFYAKRDAGNAEYDELFKRFVAKDPEAIEWMIGECVDSITIPFSYRRFCEIEHIADSKTAIIDFMFPTIEDIPTLKSVSYIKSKKEMKETYHPEAYIKKKYESVNYQLVMAIVNQVFRVTSGIGIVDTVSLNGLVHTVDKTTGNEIEPYILSLCISREEFEKVNLSSVDPREWFKSSKGVSAASLAKVTPVAPIIKMTKTDRRFIEGYEVADTLDDSMNLAAMDWQDFEHLIREIFEKEFSGNGGEVKITQASRDGGVDAVAFDPDPIRGGKIVIQAKRYTNVVGVSAVRDLYGTVLNEGAIKGILVTTSNYGNDAYEFANGKPLTLMNGSNLLYLLERHGYKARIDLKEAKEILKEESQRIGEQWQLATVPFSII